MAKLSWQSVDVQAISVSCGLRWFCWHRWQTVRDTGKTRYEECARCHGRRARQRPGGYQPVDFTWVKTGQWKKLPVMPTTKRPPLQSELEVCSECGSGLNTLLPTGHCQDCEDRSA